MEHLREIPPHNVVTMNSSDDDEEPTQQLLEEDEPSRCGADRDPASYTELEQLILGNLSPKSETAKLLDDLIMANTTANTARDKETEPASSGAFDALLNTFSDLLQENEE